MINIDELKFDDRGLIPAVVIDSSSKQVLMLAYMNRQSLEISIKEGKTCFWSRSREQLWRKGETSGNRQHIVSIKADCDCDALEVTVNKDGPACHTGAESCFYNAVWESGAEPGFTLEGLYSLLQDRRETLPEGSYTSYLFQKGIDKSGDDYGPPSISKSANTAETVYEIADLAYHVMVLVVHMGIPLETIRSELASRHIIDHKVKQERMTP